MVPIVIMCPVNEWNHIQISLLCDSWNRFQALCCPVMDNCMKGAMEEPPKASALGYHWLDLEGLAL